MILCYVATNFNISYTRIPKPLTVLALNRLVCVLCSQILHILGEERTRALNYCQFCDWE